MTPDLEDDSLKTLPWIALVLLIATMTWEI